MNLFNFEGPKAEEALVMVSHQLDFLIDYLDQPAVLALPLAKQMELITDQIAKNNAMQVEHMICTLALCFIRLLEARHATPTPEGRPDT